MSVLLLVACIALAGLAVFAPTAARVGALGLLAIAAAAWAATLEVVQARAGRGATVTRDLPGGRDVAGRQGAPVHQADARQYRRLVDEVEQVVFEVDAHARWAFLNPAWQALTGRDVAATLGQPVESALHPDDQPDTLAMLGALLEGTRRDCSCEVRFTTASGDVCWTEVRARALVQGEAVAAVVGTITDVGALRQLRLELEDARAVAERANSARSEFLRAMSHGMRTPLNGVLGLMDLLAASRLDPQQARYVSVARASASHLGTLIDDILDLSRIEVGALPLDRSLFDLPDLIRRSVASVVPTAGGRGVMLTTALAPAVPTWVVGDPGRVQQVILTLLASALEASRAGSVHLSGNARADVAGRRVTLRLEVREACAGAEAQPATGQPDVRPTTPPPAGAGLGLTICRRLVAAMHGTLEVRDDESPAPWFVVEVPFDLADAAMVEAHRVASAPLRVLAVLGDAGDRAAIGEMLEGWRFDAVIVADADAAWAGIEAARAARSRFGVLVLDPALPDAAALATRVDRLRQPPGVIWVAAGARVAHDGARRHTVAHPVQPSELFDAIMGIVATQALADDLPPPSWDVPPVVLVAEDHDVNQVVIRELLTGIGCRVDLAANGEEAVTAACARRYDAILMDCQMPILDGLEATRRIRHAGGPNGHVPPIIALTANASSEDRQACLDAGMDAYLTKPVRAAVLQRTLLRLLGGSPAAPAPLDAADPYVGSRRPDAGPDRAEHVPDVSVASARSRLDGVPEPDEILDPVDLLLRCNRNGDLGARMLELFAASLPAELDALVAAAAGGDMKAVSAIAHKMRGAAATLAAVRLAGALTAIELFLTYGDGGPLAELVADVQHEGALLLGVAPQVVRQLTDGSD